MTNIINKLRNKIYLLIGRAILKAVSNTASIQKLKVTGLYNETISGVDRIQEYGLETYPKVGTAEVVILFPNGNRDGGVVIKVGDKTYRPSGQLEGDVYLYDYRGTEIKIDSIGITLKSGDASAWKPNVLAIDPWSGITHGGIPAGIRKLIGG